MTKIFNLLQFLLNLICMSLQVMSKHDTEFYNYKNIFACLKKKNARNQALGMHYPCTKQVIKCDAPFSKGFVDHRQLVKNLCVSYHDTYT